MKRTLILAAAIVFAVSARAAVLQINVNDMIHPISDEFIGRALAEAQRTHAEALLIVLQTPGGLLDSTRSIVEKIMTARVPVIVYVAPAGSRRTPKSVAAYRSPLLASRAMPVTGWSPMSYERSTNVAVCACVLNRASRTCWVVPGVYAP